MRPRSYSHLRLMTTILAVLVLAAIALAVLALSFRATRAAASQRAWAADGQTPIRTECGRPRGLRLVRFEDGSAQLRCAGRILVRVAVPG